MTTTGKEVNGVKWRAETDNLIFELVRNGATIKDVVKGLKMANAEISSVRSVGKRLHDMRKYTNSANNAEMVNNVLKEEHYLDRAELHRDNLRLRTRLDDLRDDVDRLEGRKFIYEVVLGAIGGGLVGLLLSYLYTMFFS